MNPKDTRVVSQLVRIHLLMSTTAQRKDVSDPEVVHQFARAVGSESMLNYLYLLTVADIRGTNPQQWNNWKDSLLRELYLGARKVLRQGTEQPQDVDEIIQENREVACEQITRENYSREQIESLCGDFPGDYFLHHKAEQVVWHVTSIIDNREQESVVDIRQSIRSNSTEIFIYTRDIDHVFSRVVGVLSSMNLDILYADIYTTSRGQTLDTFIIQDANGDPLSDSGDIEKVRSELLQALDSDHPPKVTISQRMPRQLKSFKSPSRVEFTQDLLNQRTIMEINSIDRPGLLYTVSRLIADVDLEVSHAKIATLGERVEDIFYLTTNDQRAVTDADLLQQLATSIIATLDQYLENENNQEITI
jgi:[protein-PII] uridylyltransferase